MHQPLLKNLVVFAHNLPHTGVQHRSTSRGANGNSFGGCEQAEPQVCAHNLSALCHVCVCVRVCDACVRSCVFV